MSTAVATAVVLAVVAVAAAVVGAALMFQGVHHHQTSNRKKAASAMTNSMQKIYTKLAKCSMTCRSIINQLTQSQADDFALKKPNRS